jgi:hypothetical protein
LPAKRRLAGEAVEDATGAFELRKTLFFGNSRESKTG